MRSILLGMVALIVLLLVMPVSSQSTDQITVNNIKVYPSPIYVRDRQVNLVANITSQKSLQRVWLRYGYSSTGNVNQVFNYSVAFMYLDNAIGRNQYWAAQLPVPSTPSLLVLYLNATDVDGCSIIYPGANNPESHWVMPVPNATFYPPSLTINSLTLGLQYSYANLTVGLAGELPYPSWGYWTTVSMYSLPRGDYIESNLALLESSSSRFYYTGKASFLTELNGTTKYYPYDSYLLGVNISIPYRDFNVTFGPNYPVRLNPSNLIASSYYDTWQPPVTKEQQVQHHGNNTNLLFEFVLNRQNPSPSFSMIGAADTILMAFALVFPAALVERRLTVYLASVIIPITLLISPSLNPFGFGVTIFESYFSYLMLANALLIGSSIVAWRVKDSRIKGGLDVGTGVLTACLAYYSVSGTPMPPWAWQIALLIPILAFASRFADREKKGKRVVEQAFSSPSSP